LSMNAIWRATGCFNRCPWADRASGLRVTAIDFSCSALGEWR
jgi:hypothetical protein